MDKKKVCGVVFALMMVLGLILLYTSLADETATIIVGDVSLTVEIADTQAERSSGLMSRNGLDRDRGMLFIFPEARYLSFWMKNTYIPLSIAFIDDGHRIIAIMDMEPLDEGPRYNSPGPAIWALEVNRGWFEENGVEVGDTVLFVEDNDNK